MTFIRITASLQKRGSRFYVYFYDPTRTPQRKSFALGDGFSTRRKAEQRMNELLQQAHEGLFDPWTYRKEAARPPASSSLEGLSQRFLEDRGDLRQATLRAYRTALRGFIALCPPGLSIAHVNEGHVQAYVASGQVSPETRAHRFRHLRVFFNWAVKEKVLRRSPVANMKPPRVGHKEAGFLTKEQFERLRATAEAEEARGRPVAWLWRGMRMALITGMRRGELCNLRWGAVDLGEEGFLTVRSDETFQTKSGHERRVPMTEPLREVLGDLHDDQFGEGMADPDAFVLRGRRGGPLNADAFTKAVKELMKKAGLPSNLRLHSLRHTHASWLAMSGTPMVAVSRLLGHSSTQMTQRYSHITDTAFRGEIERTFGVVSPPGKKQEKAALGGRGGRVQALHKHDRRRPKKRP